jgi:hypothetical protein
MLCPWTDIPAKSRSSTSRSSSCRGVGVCESESGGVELFRRLSENLSGPWFAKISRPIIARPDRGFRITASSFSFRDGDIVQSASSEPPHVHTSSCIATFLCSVIPEYTTTSAATREEENVGLGLGSWFGRDGILRTTPQSPDLDDILGHNHEYWTHTDILRTGPRSTRRIAEIRWWRWSTGTGILQGRL